MATSPHRASGAPDRLLISKADRRALG